MDNIETKIDRLAETVDTLAKITKDGFDHVHKEISDLKDGQEQIKLRLDNVAYRF